MLSISFIFNSYIKFILWIVSDQQTRYILRATQRGVVQSYFELVLTLFQSRLYKPVGLGGILGPRPSSPLLIGKFLNRNGVFMSPLDGNISVLRDARCRHPEVTYRTSSNHFKLLLFFIFIRCSSNRQSWMCIVPTNSPNPTWLIQSTLKQRKY